MRYQPLFQAKKNWKGPLDRHEKTNVLCDKQSQPISTQEFAKTVYFGVQISSSLRLCAYCTRKWKKETDPVHCDQERALCCVAGISSFKNGAKFSCSGAGIVPKVAFLVWTEAYFYKLSATLRFTIRYSIKIALTLFYGGICTPPAVFATDKKRLTLDCWNFMTFIVSLLYIIWYTIWSPGT